MLVLALLLLGTHPRVEPVHTEAPCRRAGEGDSPLLPLPASWNMQLVGVSADSSGRTVAVIRLASGRTARTRILRAGESLWGRLHILGIARGSVLVRADGVLHTLKLRNRAWAVDWNAGVRRWPMCTATPG